MTWCYTICPLFPIWKLVDSNLIIKEHLPKGALQDEGTRYILPFDGWHPPQDPPQTADTLVWSRDFVKFIIRVPFGVPQEPHLISSRNSSPVPERSNWNPPRRHSPNEKQSPPLPNFTGFPSEMANLKSFCFTKPFLGLTRILLNLKIIWNSSLSEVRTLGKNYFKFALIALWVAKNLQFRVSSLTYGVTAEWKKDKLTVQSCFFLPIHNKCYNKSLELRKNMLYIASENHRTLQLDLVLVRLILKPEVISIVIDAHF